MNNPSTEREPQGNKRKCSMCNKPGHNIKHCNDAASKNRLNEIETRFINTMKNRLYTNWDDSSEYLDLVAELRNTVPKNLMKFTVIKFGGYSTSLTTKLKLFGMFMFQMIRRFMNHEYEFIGTISHIKVQLLNAERSFWLWISSGNSLHVSREMYEHRVREILTEQERNIMQSEEMILFPIKIILVMDLTESNRLYHEDVSAPCLHEAVSTFNCDICFDINTVDNKVTFDCGHSFCGTCVQTTFKMCKVSSKKPTCAMCRNEYTSLTVTSDNLHTALQEFCQ